MVKNPPAMQETQVRSLGQEDPLQEVMVTHSSILIWRIPWTEEPGGLQSMGSQRVRHDWASNTPPQENDELVNSVFVVILYFRNLEFSLDHPIKFVPFYLQKWMDVKVAQSCPTLCDPMDCSGYGQKLQKCLLKFKNPHPQFQTSMIE